MTNTDLEFIQSALNAYWNDAHQQLQRKDLGDIERKNYEYQLSNSKRLLTQIEQSHIQLVMQAEGSDVSEGAAVGNGAAGQSGSGEICGHHHTNHIWTNGHAYTQCLLCGKRWAQI